MEFWIHPRCKQLVELFDEDSLFFRLKSYLIGHPHPFLPPSLGSQILMENFIK